MCQDIAFFDDETKEKNQNQKLVSSKKKRVLYIEDEEMVINVAKLILERLGYEVEVSMRFHEAIGLVRSRPDNFDLVITDMSMPGMNGIELSQKLLEIRPDIPIILCTGFSELIDEKETRKTGISAIIPKPFMLEDMDKVIRKVISDYEE